MNRATANNDHTVVSLACAGGHLAVVELLLAHGADPTHRLKVMHTLWLKIKNSYNIYVFQYMFNTNTSLKPCLFFLCRMVRPC